MTIIEVKKKNARSYIEKLMKRFVSNQHCMGLLRFFANHTDARFSKLAIIHAIDEDCNRIEMGQALEDMVREKVLDVTEENGIIYYALTKEEALRRLVQNMAIFQWSDWQLVLEHA